MGEIDWYQTCHDGRTAEEYLILADVADQARLDAILVLARLFERVSTQGSIGWEVDRTGYGGYGMAGRADGDCWYNANYGRGYYLDGVRCRRADERYLALERCVVQRRRDQQMRIGRTRILGGLVHVCG